MTAMICCGVTPCLGVSMTSTSVVLGIATLGTPEAPPDWDCATDAAGITAIRSIAIRKGIVKFIRLSFRFSLVRSILKRVRPHSFRGWYHRVPPLNLDAASYRWLQRNSSGHASPDCMVPLGTISLLWYYAVPGSSRRG